MNPPGSMRLMARRKVIEAAVSLDSRETASSARARRCLASALVTGLCGRGVSIGFNSYYSRTSIGLRS